MNVTMAALGAAAGWILASAAATADATKQLTLGVEDDAGPWSYANGSGYANDLVKAAYAAAGWQVTLQVLPYARCKAMAMSGKLAGCFSASKTPELEQRMLFPKNPVFVAHFMLTMPSGSPPPDCHTNDWGRGWRIETVNGYEYPPRIESLKSRTDLVSLTSNSESLSLRKLVQQRIDATIVTIDEVKRLDMLLNMAGVAYDSVQTSCELGSMPAYIMFSASHPQGQAALQAFDHGYQSLLQHGAIKHLQDEWRQRALDYSALKYQ